MKKLLFLFLLFMGLIPAFKNGHISFIGSPYARADDFGTEEPQSPVLGQWDPDCNCWINSTLGEVTVTAEAIQQVVNDYSFLFVGVPTPQVSDFNSMQDFLDYVDQLTQEYSQENPDCPPDAKRDGSGVASQYNSGVKSATQNFGAMGPTANEQGFTVRMTNGVYTDGPMITGSSHSGISVPFFTNTVAEAHTHPDGNNTAPSYADVVALGHDNAVVSGFKTEYIIASDGSKYALQIDNAAGFQTFLTNNANALDPVTNSVSSSSALGVQFNKVRQAFTDAGSTPNEAFERAMASILTGSGVTLLKAASGSDDFKKIGTVAQKDANGNPVLDGNGQPTYRKSDC